MNYETYTMMLKHIQNLRRSLAGDPSAATFAAWHLDDTRHGMMQDYYAHREEDDDSFTFDFTSEVKPK